MPLVKWLDLLLLFCVSELGLTGKEAILEFNDTRAAHGITIEQCVYVFLFLITRSMNWVHAIL